MFVEESLWLRESLSRIDLKPGSIALDVGSSTNEYRLRTQPHIEQNVLSPLRGRGLELRSLDSKPGDDIDYVCDLTDGQAGVDRTVGMQFDLVLCNNVLVHLSDPHRGAARLPDLVAPDGWLVVSTPTAYRRVRDPLDNGLRPTPKGLIQLLLPDRKRESEFDVVAEGKVRINQHSYYRWSLLKPSWFRVGNRWLPVPGVVEQLRYLLPPLRWAVSCVMLRRKGEHA